MNIVSNKWLSLLLPLAVLLLAACQGGQAATPQSTPVPTVVGDARVTVEGKLVPLKHANLSFNMGGLLTEVLVEEGQQVEVGQVLARLDRRDQLESNVAQAQVELVAARQALDDLRENADVATAAAQQKVAKARDDVRYAERYLNNLNSGSRGTDVEKARANVVILKDRLEEARKDFAPYENKPEDNVTRANYQSQLADAQRKYDDAARLLNNLEGTPSDIDLAVGEANLSLAQAQLTLAEQEYQDVKDGPDPDALEAAQARLKSAQAGLEAAQSALDDSELKAPFAGTVVRLDLKAGEQAVPGAPAVVLADLAQWRVETEDLNEMEIPQVQVGQPATIIPDALPDLELAGKVETISQYYVERFGDVTYTAKLALEESDPRLRWGMTVSVRFEE